MKTLKPKKGYHFVRVDSKLIIEVHNGKSDEKAIQEYKEKLKNTKPNASHRWKHDHEKN